MKQTIKLTENDIRRMVMEAMNELDWKTYQNAAKSAHLKALDNYGNNPDFDVDNYNEYLTKLGRFSRAAEDAFNQEHGYDNGRYHIGLRSDRHGSNVRTPSTQHFPYHDDSRIRTYDRKNTFNWMGTKMETPLDLDYSFDRGLVPGEVNDKYDAAKQELEDYKTGKSRYEKGKGWTKDELEEAVTRSIRKYLK